MSPAQIAAGVYPQNREDLRDYLIHINARVQAAWSMPGGTVAKRIIDATVFENTMDDMMLDRILQRIGDV